MAIVSDTEYLKYLQSVTGVTVPAAGTAFLTMIYPMIVAEIERYLGWKIEQSTITEYHPAGNPPGPGESEGLLIGYDKVGNLAMPIYLGGSGMNILTLRNTPVRSITAIYENAAAWDSGEANGTFPEALPAGSWYADWTIPGRSDSGMVYRRLGIWNRQPRSIKVIYSAGLTAEEIAADYSDLKMAIMEQLTEEYKRSVAAANAAADGGVTQSVSIEDFSTSMQPLTTVDNYKYGLPPYIKQRLSPLKNYAREWSR